MSYHNADGCDDEECDGGSGSETPVIHSSNAVFTTSTVFPTPPTRPLPIPSTTTPSREEFPYPTEYDFPSGGYPEIPTPVPTPQPEVITRKGNGDYPQSTYGSPHPEPGGSKHPTQGSSNSVPGTSGDGVALVIGIVAGILSVVVLVILLVCKFCVQSEGSYKVDESKNYQFAGRGSPSLDGIHGPSYGMGGGGGGMGLGLGPMGIGMGGGADGRGMYGAGGLGFINGQQPQMNGNVKMGEKACKLPKKKDLKDIKEWYV